MYFVSKLVVSRLLGHDGTYLKMTGVGTSSLTLPRTRRIRAEYCTPSNDFSVVMAYTVAYSRFWTFHFEGH